MYEQKKRLSQLNQLLKTFINTDVTEQKGGS